MSNNTKVTIITIGDELLIGQVIDTNSAWMAQELNKLGMLVIKRIAVGDDWNSIWKALDNAATESNLILITGGLGPTADDITKPLLCKYFAGKLVVNEKVLIHITDIFERILKRPMIERNAKQAEVPDVCTVLHNSRGTAPGMLFEKEGKLFISMPGVPHEMKGIMTDVVLPMLPQKFAMAHVIHKTLLTEGIGESFLAERIKKWEEQLPAFIKLAYLPNYGLVRLRLTATGNDKQLLQKTIDTAFEKLSSQLTDVLVTTLDEPMESVVAKILKTKNKTLSTAESCTGGFIAHTITQHEGSSNYYKGSIISYANETKMQMLFVKENTLQQYGAVSEQTVIEMVQGVLQQINTDYAIAVSGIMGPGGGSIEKPIGTVWICAGNKKNYVTHQLKLRFHRKKNIEITCLQALNVLRKFLITEAD
jgi:nicotinamide-nucleotide amidase